MSLSTELAKVAAKDPRYTIEAYEFIFATLEHARRLRLQRVGSSSRGRRAKKLTTVSRHMTGQELCHAAKDLVHGLYGLMAITVLSRWGIHTTSDLGSIVYLLIESGDLEKTQEDKREDFDDVFEFETALIKDYVLDLGDPD